MTYETIDMDTVDDSYICYQGIPYEHDFSITSHKFDIDAMSEVFLKITFKVEQTKTIYTNHPVDIRELAMWSDYTMSAVIEYISRSNDAKLKKIWKEVKYDIENDY